MSDKKRVLSLRGEALDNLMEDIKGQLLAISLTLSMIADKHNVDRNDLYSIFLYQLKKGETALDLDKVKVPNSNMFTAKLIRRLLKDIKDIQNTQK